MLNIIKMYVPFFSDSNINERQKIEQKRDDRTVQALFKIRNFWSYCWQFICNIELYIQVIFFLN